MLRTDYSTRILQMTTPTTQQKAVYLSLDSWSAAQRAYKLSKTKKKKKVTVVAFIDGMLMDKTYSALTSARTALFYQLYWRFSRMKNGNAMTEEEYKEVITQWMADHVVLKEIPLE